MSDYLWDKTGEAEEDVERLEELLGQLRFQPRTFEVPATLPVVARRAPRTLYNFSWSRLAVAASLLLMLLAGAWLIKTRQRLSVAPQMATTQPAKENATAQPTQQEQQTPQQNRQESAVATMSNDSTTTQKNLERRGGALVAHNSNRLPRREFISAAQKRHGVLPRQLNERDVNAQREEIAMTPREKEAMGKFLLAMKVTSEKLGYAERQVQGLNEGTPQR
jgi:hypothetical protein